jgi:glycyl-tRNA synthetase beta chain
MPPFLFEIGCEELPAAVCESVLAQLRGTGEEPGLVFRLFKEARLLADEVVLPAEYAVADEGGAPRECFAGGALHVMVAPRRIAVLLREVPERQTSETTVFRGPRAAVAFDESGVPTKVGLGFARSRGVEPGELRREVVDGTEFAVAEVEAERRPAVDVLPDLAGRLITGLQVPRGMRWDKKPVGADEYLRFSRPIRWLVCKLGADTLSFRFYGLLAADVTQGHRVLGAPVIVDTAEHYEKHLREQRVVADQDDRRAAIVAGLEEQAARLGGVWFDPGDVLAENVYLAEWPTVLAGSFDARHLRLPAEVLITAMQSHQRYFPVRRDHDEGVTADEGGELLPAFLHVSNADPDAGALITKGNERVLEGRLDDAEFFYDLDLGRGLLAMASALEDVTFGEKLGSLADKSVRLRALAGWLAERAQAERIVLEEAAALAKADLVSQMVQEFPTLQGTMGGIYATAGGLPPAVAQAIAEHYLPVSAVAPLPGTLPGALLAVADKADNIVGAWVAGEKPSGSRDPYGLRRAATGIVRIALRYRLRFGVERLLAAALDAYEAQGVVRTQPGGEIVAETAAFVWERLEGMLLDEGLPFPLVEAAMGSTAVDLPARAERARRFAVLAGGDTFEDVVVAYNRCASLAAKGRAEARAVDSGLFREPAEGDLYETTKAVAGTMSQALTDLAVDEAVAAAARLRPVVDRYFDAVLVMAPERELRENRLAQLAETTAVLRALGDFGRLPVQAT